MNHTILSPALGAHRHAGRSPVLLGAAILALAAAVPSAFADVPPFINYQGRVTDTAGNAIGTGTPANRKVIFRIWDHPTNSGAANRLWTEEQVVTILNGDFSVILGSGVQATGTAAGESRPPLDQVFSGASTDRFLEIMVDEGGNVINDSDQPISPRQQITSTGYAMRAKIAESIASGADLALSGPAGAAAGSYGLGWYGNATAPRLFAGIDVSGPVLYGTTGGALGVKNGATENIALRWDGNGNIGVGTPSPASGSKLTLEADDPNTPPLQLTIRGSADINKRLLVGYNTTGNFGSLQAYNSASTASSLVLNPAGGNVGIGIANPASKLTVQASGIGIEHTNGPVRLATFAGGSDGGIVGSIGTVSNHGLQLYTNNTSRVIVTAAGNVGIGVFNPTDPLVVNGVTRTVFLNAGEVSANVTKSGSYVFNGGGDTDGGLFSSGDGNVSIKTNDITRVRFTPSGVGIGNNIFTAPSAPLEVFTTSANAFSGPISFFGGGNSSLTTVTAVNSNVSIRAGGVVVAQFFTAVSDARIKTIKGHSNGAADLATLNQIEITDYEFKDKVEKGSTPQKKVIAQQVERVFPQAVTRSTNVVPDLYTKAPEHDGWISLASDLKVGERVRIIGDSGKEQGIHEVTEVKEGAFRTAFQPAGDEVFVYGREVNDFRAMDYDAIAMLNVSATQELARRLEAKSAEMKAVLEENAELKTKLAAQEKRLAGIEAVSKAGEDRLAAMEKAIARASAGSGEPEAPTKTASAPKPVQSPVPVTVSVTQVESPSAR